MIRKNLYMCWKIYRRIGAQFILLLILIAFCSSCLCFAASYPLSALSLYNRYNESGIQDGLMYCTGFQFYDYWFLNSHDSPSYSEMYNILSQYGQIVTGYEVSLYTSERNRFSLMVYSNSFLEYITLPGIDSFTLLSDLSEEKIPLLIDSRLRSEYAIGDTIYDVTIYTEPDVVNGDCVVVGYLPKNNEYIRFANAGSDPSLRMIVEQYSDDDAYLVVTVQNDQIDPQKYSYPSFLIYPYDEYGGAQIIEQVTRYGLGKIMNYSDMKNTDIFRALTGDDNLLSWMFVWSAVVLIIGMRGFMANLLTRLKEQATVYKLLGVRLRQWMTITVFSFSVPCIVALLLGEAAGFYLVGSPAIQSAALGSVSLLIFSVLLILITPTVITLKKLWNHQSAIMSYYEREGS